MQFYREERMRAVRLYAGDRYSMNAAKKRRYVNFISLYCNIVGRNLFSANPRVAMGTFEMRQKAAVSAMEKWVNEEIVRMKFADTMKRIVLDALFSVGIGYCALATPSDAARFGWGLAPGQAHFCRVDPDDWVFDTEANDLSEVDYMGHRVTVDLETVADDKRHNAKARNKLTPRMNGDYNREGDERIGQIGRSLQGEQEGFKDKIDLWQFYLPKEKRIILVTENDISGLDHGVEPLDDAPWIGPDSGPYHVLAFQLVPGNPFPKGPIQDSVNLDESLNESYRKLVRQAADQKDVTVCQMQNTEDGKRIQDSKDRDVLPLNNPKDVSTLSMNGINEGQMLFMREVFERASLMAGNLITMGGLAPQAGTLGQEELLASQSNGQVASMQDTTAAFVERAFGKDGMGWFWWNDPDKVMQTTYDLNVPGLEMNRKVTPWNSSDPLSLPRLGPIPQIRVDPFSMRYRTPQQRFQELNTVFKDIYRPLAQIFMQAGVVPDMNAAMVLIAKYLDNPDIQTVFTISEPPTEETGTGASHQRMMPTETERTYNRRSLGNSSAQAESAMMETELESGLSSPGKMNGQPQYA